MEFCWGLPVVPVPNTTQLLDHYIHQARLAEMNGFDSVLISVAPTSVDPMIAATLIGMKVEQIRILIAQNTNQVLPTVTAKALNTLNKLIGDRADINIVTGSASIVLARDAKPEPHELRYRRTGEFVELLQKLRTGTASFDGDFYRVENCDIYPRENHNRLARYFVAGSSEAAMRIAGQYGDAYIMYATDRKTLANQFSQVKVHACECGRDDIQLGVLVDIITRETTEEALSAANELVDQTSPAIKRMTKLFLNNADSVGLKRYKDIGAEGDYWVDEHLWAGLNMINPSNSISIVASYQNTIATLTDYWKAGARYFILTSQFGESDIERIGRNVITPLREFILERK